ncbi:MAG TPA: signal peptidase I [Ktedonobacteraceae bacterium]|nr:signal peptidase I [Ktedonobacteraceae bacterium]
MNPEFDFEKRYRLVREIIETIVLTLLMFLIIRFAIQNFNVDGTSMEPNLHNGELILVDKWTYLFRPPARGDVIVFVAPPHPDMDYVKRVIGVPGDVITIRDTVVIVDGVTLNETYVDPRNQGNLFANKNITNLVVPPNDYFVLGDNRAVSSDSRDWGFVPKANIIGRAAFVYWPLGQDNNGFLKNYAFVFANVHQPNSRAVGAPNSNNGPLNLDGLLLICMPGCSLALQRRRQNQSGSSAFSRRAGINQRFRDLRRR